MKSFFDYVKKLVLKSIIDQLKANSDKYGKIIASKADIPFLNEKQEAELAEKGLEGVTELIEILFEDILKGDTSKK